MSSALPAGCNSSLLWRQDVREELARADLVVPSLDDLAEGLRVDRNELVKCLSVLTSEGRIAEAGRNDKTYYKAA